MTRLILLFSITLLSTTGCKKQQSPPQTTGSSAVVADSAGAGTDSALPADAEGMTGSGSGAATVDPDTSVASGSAAPAGSASGSAAPGKPGKNKAIAIVQGTSCDGRGQQITKAGESRFKLANKVLAGQHMHGCGCPTKPVHTLVYKVASPLEVRICFDQTADSCEMACRDVSFDLSAALGAAKATDIKFVD